MQDNVYLLKILRIIARLISIIGLLYILAAIVVFLTPGAFRMYAFDIQRIFSACIPFGLRGRFIFALPFGGGLRGDFILYGIALKLLGKLLVRAAKKI